jgi:hypothetical protein
MTEESGFTITPMNPTEIVDYIHSEFTPFSQLPFDQAKAKMVEMIQRYADWYLMSKSKQEREFVPE